MLPLLPDNQSHPVVSAGSWSQGVSQLPCQCVSLSQAGPTPTYSAPFLLGSPYHSPSLCQPIMPRRLQECCLRVTLATSQGFLFVCFFPAALSFLSLSLALFLSLCLVRCIFKGSVVILLAKQRLWLPGVPVSVSTWTVVALGDHLCAGSRGWLTETLWLDRVTKQAGRPIGVWKNKILAWKITGIKPAQQLLHWNIMWHNN